MGGGRSATSEGCLAETMRHAGPPASSRWMAEWREADGRGGWAGQSIRKFGNTEAAAFEHKRQTAQHGRRTNGGRRGGGRRDGRRARETDGRQAGGRQRTEGYPTGGNATVDEGRNSEGRSGTRVRLRQADCGLHARWQSVPPKIQPAQVFVACSNGVGFVKISAFYTVNRDTPPQRAPKHATMV